MSELFDECLVDLFLISESKLDDSFPNAQFNMNGYRLHRNDRTANGGGLMMYIRSDIPHRTRPELHSQSAHVESMVFEVHIKCDKWLFVGVYSPHKRYEDELILFLNDIYEKEIGNYKDIVCIGDINVDLSCGKTKVNDELLDIYDLYNLIKDPTCFKSEKGSLLDPIIVTNRNHFVHAFNLSCGFSDFHNFVGCITKCHFSKQEPRKITYRSFRKFNETLFKCDVANITLNKANNEPSKVFKEYQTKIIEICNKHAPIKQRTIKKQQVPYMNKQLRSAMFVRNQLRNKYYVCRNKENWDKYRKQRNLVTSIRRKSIGNYFQNKCSNITSSKDFWCAIKPFLTDKNCKAISNSIILKENENIVCDSQKVCGIFNDFFASIADNIGRNRTPVDISKPDLLNDAYRMYQNHPSILAIKRSAIMKSLPFAFKEVSPQYICNKIKKLNPKKSAGPDTIPPKLIKMVSNELCIEFCDMINICIKSCIFPEDMKYADITPLYKKKDVLSKNNYRPVNVIGILSKLFEIILADQLGEFFSDLFSEFLSAYRKGHSCQNSLLYMTDVWRQALDKNMHVGAVLMDLSKAFDCLPPDLFIAKLNAYNVSNEACRLIASYLTTRKQRVKIGMERSSWRETVKGVPQGSGLGPLIFNIFINDLIYFTERCQILNYADDNTIYSCHLNVDCIVQDLQNDSKVAIKWFENNYMEANPTKFQFILLSPQNKRTASISTLPLLDIHIDRSDCVKLLGIDIDDKLNFHEHITVLCKKAARQLNAFKRLSRNLNVKDRESIYNSFIVSVFSYCPLVWHFCRKSDHKKIEKINERALRIVYNDYISTYEALLNYGNKLSLGRYRMLNFATELYKIKNGKSVEMMNIFDVPKETPYNLRCNDQNVIPIVKTKHYGINSFRYLSSHIWNQIPDNVKKAKDANTFKVLLQQWSGFDCKCSSCENF